MFGANQLTRNTKQKTRNMMKRLLIFCQYHNHILFEAEKGDNYMIHGQLIRIIVGIDSIRVRGISDFDLLFNFIANWKYCENKIGNKLINSELVSSYFWMIQLNVHSFSTYFVQKIFGTRYISQIYHYAVVNRILNCCSI